MSANRGKKDKLLYKLVLTGGPCGGKTTGQARLSTFFENLGWKVYRVPETATLLLSGGVKFPSMSEDEVFNFQENLIKTMMQIEDTYVDLAQACSKNCLIICDRGVMDASAYMKSEQWAAMKEKNGWNEVDLRDGRYNEVIHMVSAAKGAEHFYHIENHAARHEGVELARQLDDMTSQAWVGHPYYDVIDNGTDFERKVIRMISAVCNRLGVDTKDRLDCDSRKRKFLVTSMPTDESYPQFQDFKVVHDYLVTPHQHHQARIRKRGQNGNWTYVHTIRRPAINNESPEVKTVITEREYKLLYAQRDKTRDSVQKKRRCFLWNNQYFQLDIYEEPSHSRCKGLMILETFTTAKGAELTLPGFLKIEKEVTDDSQYSMYILSVRDPPLAGRQNPEGPDVVKQVNGLNVCCCRRDWQCQAVSLQCRFCGGRCGKVNLHCPGHPVA